MVPQGGAQDESADVRTLERACAWRWIARLSISNDGDRGFDSGARRYSTIGPTRKGRANNAGAIFNRLLALKDYWRQSYVGPNFSSGVLRKLTVNHFNLRV